MGAMSLGGPRLALVVSLGAVLLLSSCAPGPAASRTDTGGSPQAGSAPKTLRMATRAEPVAGIAVFGGSGDGNAQNTWMYHAGLTAYDGQGNLLPRLARKVPSVADGDWVVLPDGGMEVTWKLRPNLKWHDGTALSAEDFVLGIQVARDPELPLPRTGGVSLVSAVTAPDPETLVVRWSSPYFGANEGSPAEFPAVPRHIVGELYRQGDKKAFTNSPYWATEFVGLGPYKLGEWVQGAYTEALAFDDYVLGRPKIDRIIVRYISDATTTVANLLSGDIDLVTIGSIKMEDVEPLIRAWEPTGAGSVIPSMTDVSSGRFQFKDPNAPWARDARVRQALLHLLDRDSMAATFSPGGSRADLFLAKEDPVYRLADQRGFARYPYDLTQAERLLAQAGWTRATGGGFQNATGQRFSIEVRSVETSPLNTRQALAVMDQWKQGGVDSELTNIPNNVANRSELKAATEGIYMGNETVTADVLQAFTSAQLATPQNNWAGRNFTSYLSPEYDALYARFVNELDTTRRQSVEVDLQSWAARELFALPFFYTAATGITSFRRGIRGPGPVLPVLKVGTWNIHDWEMD